MKKQKDSEFIKSIKEHEAEGYIIEGAILAFTTSEGQRGTFIDGDMSIMLRCAEEIKLQKDLLKERRKNIVQNETKSALGNSKTEIPSYTN